MTIEEKAKRYDEAVKRVENIKTGKCETIFMFTEGLFEYIFPELAESEDERIRKALIKYIKGITSWNYFLGISKEQMIAWLEKQGEQKPTEKVEPKFNIGDTIVNKDGDKCTITNRCLLHQYYSDSVHSREIKFSEQGNWELVEQNPVDRVEPKFHEGEWIIHHGTENIYQVVARIDNQYQLKYGDNYTIQNCVDVDRCSRLYDVAKDAKDGDVLATSAGAFIYNGNNGGGSCPGSYCGIDTLGRFKTGVKHHWTGKKVYPATKEQHDTLMKAMTDAGYTFDFEKKELKKIEQKPAWSEEDETITSALSQLLKDCESENSWNCVYSNDREVFFVDIENWLKSLKDRVQPKQEWSEEDESMRIRCIGILSKCYIGELPTKVEEELNWLKSSLKPQKLLTNEEIEQAKKEYRDEALSKVDYIPEELTYDDGWDDAISYMKKSLRPQT